MKGEEEEEEEEERREGGRTAPDSAPPRVYKPPTEHFCPFVFTSLN